MVELALTVHHAHLPTAHVGVSEHLVRLARLRLLRRPVELTNTVELSELEVAAVLAAVGSDKVAVTMAGAIVPLSSVLADLVGLDLNSMAVTDCYEFRQQFLVDL